MCFKGLKTFSVGKSGCCFPAEAQMLYHVTAVPTTVSYLYSGTFLFNLVRFFTFFCRRPSPSWLPNH